MSHRAKQLLLLTLVILGMASSLIATAPKLVAQQAKLSISLELPAPMGGRGRPPYTAIWLETLDGEAVTTIEVRYNRTRWLPELSQWWRKFSAAGPEIDAVTGATLRAGIHEVNWDGRTHTGDSLTSGEYYVWIEAAREHGGHDRVRVKVDLGQPGSVVTAQGQSELGQIQIRVN